MATGKVKIDPPNQLPPSGLTPIKYKQWKIALKIFLQQTPDFREYYPGGKYTNWTPLEDNPHRISSLAANDTVPGDTTDEEHLAQRRLNLETFLGIIARYSDEGDFDEIMEKSSSLEWIHNLHERRYGIQKKGRHFNRIDSIRFDKTTMSDYNKFYNDLRSCFRSNLRKTGDNIKYKNCTLTEDEKVPPTTECLLIYMALERIDQRLPAEIDRIFGHLMDDSTTLIDLQTEIFSYIPRALASLDKEEQSADLNAYHIYEKFNQDMHIQQDNNDQPEVNAIYSRSYSSQRGNRTNNRGRAYYKNTAQRSMPRSQKYCKICNALEMPQHIVQSHNHDQCHKRTLLQELDLLSHQAAQYQHNTEDEYYEGQYNNTDQDQ